MLCQVESNSEASGARVSLASLQPPLKLLSRRDLDEEFHWFLVTFSKLPFRHMMPGRVSGASALVACGQRPAESVSSLRSLRSGLAPSDDEL